MPTACKHMWSHAWKFLFCRQPCLHLLVHHHRFPTWTYLQSSRTQNISNGKTTCLLFLYLHMFLSSVSLLPMLLLLCSSLSLPLFCPFVHIAKYMCLLPVVHTAGQELACVAGVCLQARGVEVFCRPLRNSGQPQSYFPDLPGIHSRQHPCWGWGDERPHGLPWGTTNMGRAINSDIFITPI